MRTINEIPQTSSTGIDYRFKILYALGMVFIVACHCGNGGVSLFYEWFAPYSFHLPLFAFCSGYFYKEQSENHVVKYCIRKAKHLLIPLYLWNFFYAIVSIVMNKLGFNFTSFALDANGIPRFLFVLLLDPLLGGSQFLYNMGGWFVAPLLLVQISSIVIRRIFRNLNPKYKEHVLFCLYLLLGIAGCLLSIKLGTFIDMTAGDASPDRLFTHAVRVLYFLPFFGAGIYYKKVLEKLDRLSNTLYFSIIFLCTLAIIVIYQRPLQYIAGYCNDFTEGPIMPFIVGFLGIAFWLRIARILEPAIGRSRTINAIADNTFSIMVNQFLGFIAVNIIFAIMSHCSLISGFDMYQFRTDIFYTYYLRGMHQTLILYLAAGLFVPILMQRIVNAIKGFFRSHRLHQ